MAALAGGDLDLPVASLPCSSFHRRPDAAPDHGVVRHRDRHRLRRAHVADLLRARRVVKAGDFRVPSTSDPVGQLVQEIGLYYQLSVLPFAVGDGVSCWTVDDTNGM